MVDVYVDSGRSERRDKVKVVLFSSSLSLPIYFLFLILRLSGRSVMVTSSDNTGWSTVFMGLRRSPSQTAQSETDLVGKFAGFCQN